MNYSKQYLVYLKGFTARVLVIVSLTLTSCHSGLTPSTDNHQNDNQILFTSNRQNPPYPYQLYVADQYGNNVRRLSHLVDSISILWASWSPQMDHLAIVWNYYDIRAQEYPFLSIADSLGNFSRSLVSVSNFPVVWSPDEQQVAYNFDGINVVNVNSGSVRKVSSPRDTTYVVSDWSSDGSKFLAEALIIDSTNIIRQSDIVELDLSGNLLRQVVKTDSILEYFARWSPNGRSIGVVYLRPGDYYSVHATGVYVVDSEGKNIVMVGPEVRTYADSSMYHFHVCWSPSSDKIGFSKSMRSFQVKGINYIVNRDGTGQIHLFTQTSSIDWILDWR